MAGSVTLLKMINHFTSDRKVLCPKLCEFWSAFMWHEAIFLFFSLYLDYDSTEYMWYKNVNCWQWKVSIACLKPSLKGYFQHEDRFLFGTFFLIFYTVLSITRLLHEKAHKKCFSQVCQWCFVGDQFCF
jgi:hypothetical protein